MTELEKALSGEAFDRRAEDVRAFQSKVNPCRVLREVTEEDKFIKQKNF